jgi:hypothetical protein
MTEMERLVPMAEIDQPPRYRPQILVLTALLTVIVTFLVWLVVDARMAESSAARRPVAIRAELTQRMRDVLERLPPGQHQGHGGQTGPDGKPVTTVCGTRVYGYDPIEAATVEDVVVVYGFHLCGLAEPGRPWDQAMKIAAPLVIRFDTQPPTVQIAESGAGISYRDRVKELIPERYQQMAFQEALGPDAMAELRRRYDAVAGPASTPAG